MLGFLLKVIRSPCVWGLSSYSQKTLLGCNEDFKGGRWILSVIVGVYENPRNINLAVYPRERNNWKRDIKGEERQLLKGWILVELRGYFYNTQCIFR